MVLPESYGAVAFNQVPDSNNRIHSDEVARQHGFEGGLVPGVTVSAYLVHPAVVAWGVDFLDRGRAHVTVKKPVYDARAFRVTVEGASDDSFRAALADDRGTICATADVSLPKALPAPPVKRNDPAAGDDRVPPTREGMELLRQRGMGAIRLPWAQGLPMTTYFRDETRMPSVLRASVGGFANTSFLLGLTNWLVAANVDLGPWLHLETESQHFCRVPMGNDLIIEGHVVDLFERKGHEFVDVDVTAFLLDDSPVLTARLRAIYRLRGDRSA
jgi:hypothetical protein